MGEKGGGEPSALKTSLNLSNYLGVKRNLAQISLVGPKKSELPEIWEGGLRQPTLVPQVFLYFYPFPKRRLELSSLLASLAALSCMRRKLRRRKKSSKTSVSTRVATAW